MSNFLLTLCWISFSFMNMLVFFVLLMNILANSQIAYIFSVKLFSFETSDFSLYLLLDLKSSLFSFLVCFINFMVVIFSYYYMKGDIFKLNIFYSLMHMFVFSMLLLINVSDFFMLMFGWDGLGIVSFMLILFYSNMKSTYSALLTVFMNRIGDLFLVLGIVLFSYFYPFLVPVSNWTLPSWLVFLLVVGFMTKSALFPFSAWLPAAMSAPTPISALVHSSTLVTAGLYLMMRFYHLISHDQSLVSVLVSVGVLTSFYAGVSAIVEPDSKKVIALSTLSHLGFIATSLFLGSLSLAFSHLVAHALFKSLLFMVMGDFILVNLHAQDSRVFGSNLVISTRSALLMNFSLLNLLGFPFFTGFYSKDLILEFMHYSSSSFVVVFFMFTNVILTFMYTFNLFSVVYLSSNGSSFKMSELPAFENSFLLSGLGLFSVVLLPVLSWLNPISFVFLITPFSKFMPFIILFFVSSFFFSKSLQIKNNFLKYSWYNMMMLSTLFSDFLSYLYLKSMSSYSKKVEFGILSNIQLKTLSSLFYSVSDSIFMFFSVTSFSLMLMLFFIVIVILS